MGGEGRNGRGGKGRGGGGEGREGKGGHFAILPPPTSTSWLRHWLHNRYFEWLDRLWGPHTVDRFASKDNAKCIRFNSKFPCSTSKAVDAFAQ